MGANVTIEGENIRRAGSNLAAADTLTDPANCSLNKR